MSLVSDYHDRRTRSRALSFHQSSVYVGTILGKLDRARGSPNTTAGASASTSSAASGMVLALVLYRFLREPRRDEAEIGFPTNIKPNDRPRPLIHALSLGETLRVIFRTPVVPLLMLGFVGANFVATIFLTWTPTFLVEKFQFKLTSAGLSGTVFIHLASAASVPVAGFLADRLTRRFAGGRMLVQALGLLVGAGLRLPGRAGPQTGRR